MAHLQMVHWIYSKHIIPSRAGWCIFTYTLQPPCGYKGNCYTREWHIFSRHASWWKWLGQQRKPRCASYVFLELTSLAFTADARWYRDIRARWGRTESSPPSLRARARACMCVCVCVCVCVCEFTLMCAQPVWLIDWPPSALFKGKTRELSQRITSRRMQQLMCASCTVFLCLETRRTHAGWWLWSVWRKDRMFCCFKNPSSAR